MSSKMPNKMLIDATHPEETRVVVVRGNRVEEFDFETAQRYEDHEGAPEHAEQQFENGHAHEAGHHADAQPHDHTHDHEHAHDDHDHAQDQPFQTQPSDAPAPQGQPETAHADDGHHDT